MTKAADDNCQILSTFESLHDTKKRIYATTVCRCDPLGHREWITLPTDIAEVILGGVTNGWAALAADKDLHIKGQPVSPDEYCNENLYDG